jgi:dUTP pyrophosphatase
LTLPGGPGGEVAVLVARVRHGFEDLPLPAYETPGAAGMDLRAAVVEVTIPPGGRALVPTGIAVALPAAFEGSVRPRSGLAARHGIGLLNAPGTIDSDYRGEVQVILVNHGDAPFTVRRGDRIAQLVVAPVARASWREVAALPETARGGGGFGSTG